MSARHLTFAVLAGAILGHGCSGTDAAVPPSRAGAGDAAAEEADAPATARAVDASGPTSADVVTLEASAALETSGGALALTDGFEGAAPGGPPDPSVWSVVHVDCSGSGTLAVDDSQAHGGKHSLRVDGGGGYCDHVFISNAEAIAGVGPQVYARFFVRVGAALGQGHVTFLAMKDANDSGDDVRMGGQDAILMYDRQSDDATLPVLSPTGVADSVALAPLAWTCVELHVDQGAGTIDTWVDGKEIAGLVENGTPTADVSTQWLSRADWRPSLVDFRLGWESYSGQAMTLWFDDVALDGKRIGCGA